MMNPKIIPRSEHSITRKLMSPNALKVLYRLKEAGAQAYLVGGGVRDILLGQHPKDFDIATNLPPEGVKELFRNCRLIGRRFRLAHVHFGREIIEVATFRGDIRGNIKEEGATQSEHGMILCDNAYGTLEEDIWRRDFTVNALYYNIADFSVVDFCDGMGDMQGQVIRLIGDPNIRYREDPVRLLRAVRFAAKLHFSISPESETPLFNLGYLLEHVPAARLFEEFLKLFFKGHALPSFALLQNYGLFHYLFPQTAQCLEQENCKTMLLFLEQALHNTDERLATGKKVTPAFLLAVFLWHPLQKTILELKTDHHTNATEIFMASIGHILSKQNQSIVLPRRFTTMMQEIWLLQGRLENIQKKYVLRLLEHPRFRAAYDFLLLRSQTGENVKKQADWWTHIQTLNETEKMDFLSKLNQKKRHENKA
jgi:poly(A) polymerase